MTPLDSCIAALRSGPTDAIFKAVEKGMAEVVGHKLFTLLYVAPNGKRVKRMYSNMPKEYPVGGYKEIKETAVAQADPRPEEGVGRLRQEGHPVGLLRSRADRVAGLRIGDEHPGALQWPPAGHDEPARCGGALQGDRSRRSASPSPRCWSARSSTPSPPIRDEALHPDRHAGSGKTAILRQLGTGRLRCRRGGCHGHHCLDRARGVAEPWTQPAFIDEVAGCSANGEIRTRSTAFSSMIARLCTRPWPPISACPSDTLMRSWCGSSGSWFPEARLLRAI